MDSLEKESPESAGPEITKNGARKDNKKLPSKLILKNIEVFIFLRLCRIGHYLWL